MDETQRIINEQADTIADLRMRLEVANARIRALEQPTRKPFSEPVRWHGRSTMARKSIAEGTIYQWQMKTSLDPLVERSCVDPNAIRRIIEERQDAELKSEIVKHIERQWEYDKFTRINVCTASILIARLTGGT